MTWAITLPTRTKIAIARKLYRVAMAPRRLTGRGPELFAKRNGILWHLDLREGIDLSIYLFGAFEWSTVSAYRRIVRPGDTVLDIGANRGAHTLPLARSVGPGGRVIAFEPADAAAARLSENIALNPAMGSRIAVRRSLLVDGSRALGKPAQFPNGPIYASWPVDGHSARADAHPLHCGIPASTDGARLETLDDAWADLGFPPVSFIKLDVDGNEPAVLRGASRVLAELRPTILLELAPYGSTERGERADATESELHNAGYQLYNLRGRALAPNVGSALRSGASVNVIARHPSKTSRTMPFRPSRRAFILATLAIVVAGTGLGFLLWPEKGKDTIYNEETVAIMQRVMTPTSNGVDVGAFEGTLTKPMTRIAPRGEHWAIEPQPEYAKLLREHFPHVHVCECALSDHNGTENFLLALDDPPRSGFREQDYPTEHERTKQITVKVVRLDDLVPDSVKISFIKIDVEGAEYLVLQGAKETIRRGQPAIAFEYGKAGMNHYGTTPEMMWHLVHDELGLDMQLMRTWLDGGRAYTPEEFNRVVHESSDWMFVAYPRVAR